MAEISITKQARPEFPFFGNLFGVSPFALMRQFTEMDRKLGGNEVFAATNRGSWLPTLEVKEKDGKLFVSAELPGIKKEEVKISVTGDQLTLEGERKFEKEEKGENFYHSERSYGKFCRVIQLPDGVKASEAVAQFNNGILEISMPMIAESKQKTLQIPVQETPKAKSAAH